MPYAPDLPLEPGHTRSLQHDALDLVERARQEAQSLEAPTARRSGVEGHRPAAGRAPPRQGSGGATGRLSSAEELNRHCAHDFLPGTPPSRGRWHLAA